METTEEEYFEPYCQWKRGDKADKIDMKLECHGFKDVKVLVTRVDDEGNFIISISAEFPRRLQKKIEISKDYDPDNIHAELSTDNLCLVLTVPKKDKKLEISTPKFELRKFLQENTENMQNKFSSAVEYYYSKRKVAAYGLLLVGSGFSAYKCYTECCGVEK